MNRAWLPLFVHLVSSSLFGRTCHRLLWVTAPKGWLTLFAHRYLAFGAGYLAPVQMVDVEVMAAVGAFNLD